MWHLLAQYYYHSHSRVLAGVKCSFFKRPRAKERNRWWGKSLLSSQLFHEDFQKRREGQQKFCHVWRALNHSGTRLHSSRLAYSRMWVDIHLLALTQDVSLRTYWAWLHQIEEDLNVFWPVWHKTTFPFTFLCSMLYLTSCPTILQSHLWEALMLLSLNLHQ